MAININAIKEDGGVESHWVGWGGRKDGEFEVGRCTLLRLEWIRNEILLYSPMTYIRLLMMEDNVKNAYMCVCVCVCVYMDNWVIFLYSRN